MKNFKRHPGFQHLWIKNDGSEARYMSEPLEIKDHTAHGKILKVVTIEGGYYSLPKLILETYAEKPDDSKRYYAQYRDGNIENLHPKNLFWSTSREGSKNLDPLQHQKRSAIALNDLHYIFRLNTEYGVPKTFLAEMFGVSAMAVGRGIVRYEKLRKKNK